MLDVLLSPYCSAGNLRRLYRSDLRTVVESDYAEKVRRSISRDRLRDVLAAARKIWPRLGKEPMQARGSWPTRSEVATRLGVRLTEMPRHDAITLLGFYSPVGLLKSPRPFIFLNSAHHPLAMATAFCHEIGHHLDTVARGKPSSSASYFDWDYSSHLDDPGRTDRRCAGQPRCLSEGAGAADVRHAHVASAGGGRVAEQFVAVGDSRPFRPQLPVSIFAVQAKLP
jgi:hypothetical protein